jgi:hypothetical protein
MEIDALYPPLHTTNILETSLRKALYRADETDDVLTEPYFRKGFMDIWKQYADPDRIPARSSMVSYDMHGGLKNNRLDPPGTHIDIYA